MVPNYNMASLSSEDHVFRHIKKTWMDGDFIDPAAFRLRGAEDGLSVNWVEFYQKEAPQDTIPPLCETFKKKRRNVGANSRFALLNVADIVDAASKYTDISVLICEEDDDLSHALIKGYEHYNDLVAEALAKIVLQLFPPVQSS